MNSVFALLSCVVGWELENNCIGTENEKGERKRTINLSITQNDGFVRWIKSRMQGRKIYSVIKHFLLNCLMRLHWLSFFCLHWYNAS